MNAIRSISNYVPHLAVDTPQNMLHKAKRIAIPAIALVGASMISGVSADRYVDCINACDRNGRDAHELAKLLCYAMCWFIAG